MSVPRKVQELAERGVWWAATHLPGKAMAGRERQSFIVFAAVALYMRLL